MKFKMSTNTDNLDIALSVKNIMQFSKESFNKQVCVQGWVRSKRDSKAGLSL